MLSAHRLVVLRAVAEHGSFSAAALELGYTQSAVSQHVAALEREARVTLIERGLRPVAPTPAGRQLLEDAQPGLEHLERAERRLRELADLRGGCVRVGAFPSAHAALVPPAFAAFRRAHPGVAVVLEELEPSAAAPALRSGAVDLAVVYTVGGRPPELGPPIALRVMGADPLAVALPPGHRLRRRRSVALAELAGDAWVAPRPPNDFRTLFERLCAEAGFAPRIAAETGDPRVGAALTRAGIGAMLTPALGLGQGDGPAVVGVRDIPAARTVAVASVAGRHHPAVAAFSDALLAAAQGVLLRDDEDPAAAGSSMR
jgi:DNA-binding transcriptional LysR family regulator